MGFFEDQRKIKDALARQIEVAGGVYADPYNEIATIISVSDPKKLGRVKVSYQDGTTSDWIYVLNSNKGVLSAQFIGSSCLVGKADGNSEDAFVIGFFNKSPDAGYPGSPLQTAIVSEQVDSSRLATLTSPGDKGLVCDEGNAGREYVFDNEEGQVKRICMRVSSRQEGPEAIWNWVDLTLANITEKGVDPAVPPLEGTTTEYAQKVGIPECTKALQGQVRNFSEDRKFRNFQIKCDKDENGTYVWSPVSSPPIFFRTTLPPCNEKVHGVEAIIDSGRDSELAICLRYQGEMKWVHHRTREPVQFYREEPPPTKEQFLASRGPIPPLQQATPTSQDFIGAAGSAVLGGLLGGAVPAFGAGSPLLGALTAAGQSLPGTFDPNQALSSAALTALSSNSGVPIAQITSQLSSALAAGGVIDPNLASVLTAAGGLGDAIAQGVKNNTLDQALRFSGQGAISQAFGGLDPATRSMYTGYAAGGALGAIDVAAMIGASQLPPEISQYIAPALNIGKSLLSTQPNAINSVLNASMGLGNQSLPGVMGGLVGAAGGVGGIPGPIASSVLSSLQGGQFGPIAQSLGNFASLPGIPGLGGIAGAPQLASSALGLLGLGGQFAAFLGPAGLGLSALSALAGFSPIASILGGIPGFGGLLGGLFGGGPDCPCDPIKCRKTSHGIDSDGTKLLHPCGSVIANSHSSYDPIGNPTENNLNRVAESIGRENTLVGQELCVPNPYDLTQMIKMVNRLGEMADRIEHAKHADWPEMWSELSYTFETIEKAFKQTDNNITGVESVERKLIDSQHRLITKMMVGNDSFFSRALFSIIDASTAIRDLYGFVTALNAKKKGGKANIFATVSLKAVFENITKVAALNSASKAEAAFNIANIVVPADAEWRKLSPGLDLLNLTNIILGAVPIDIPLNFLKCLTIRDTDRILKDSLEAKLNSLVPSEPESITLANLPESAINPPGPLPSISGSVVPSTPETPTSISQTTPPRPLTDLPSISDILDQIKYNQDRTEKGDAEC